MEKGRKKHRKIEKLGKEGERELKGEQRGETNPAEEPPLQSDEHRCLSPSSSCLHRCVFPLLPSLLPLHYSSVRRESPTHGSSSCCCRSSPIQLDLLADFPNILSIYFLHLQAWRLGTGPFLLRGRASHHKAALFAVEKRRR